MHGPRVLIIERDPMMVMVFEDIHADAGYQTDVWPQCAGAVTHIRQAPPAVVLISLWLEQRGDGWTVLQALREDTLTAQLPVIICTADRQAVENDAAHYVDACCRVLIKPFDVDMFLDTMHTALGGVAALERGG